MDPNASLANLRDIVVPEPPPLWPPAPGVWVLLIVIVAVVAAFGVFGWRRWRDNAYRRAGLALLTGVQTSHDINVILKRVALAVFPRPQVASLYGDEWAAFLDDSCSRTRFARIDPVDPTSEISHELLKQAKTWIRHHRAPIDGARAGGR